MYEVRVQAGFSAAHQIRLYDGRLEPLHGHDWEVEAVFRGPELDRIGVLIDFVPARETLLAIAATLHHTHLNEAPLLAGANPTAEHVARCIFAELRTRLGPAAPLAAVHVTEAPGCIAGYSDNDAASGPFPNATGPPE
jgi:6-pyruvoyltetrahydropterin/6-carboxytetrahydropterin synthase